MTRARTAIPFFPNPPEKYHRAYMADIQRAFGQFVQIVLNPGEDRVTSLVITNMASDDVGLEPGTLYKSGNVVLISQWNIAAVRGSGAVGATGTVTVAIT